MLSDEDDRDVDVESDDGEDLDIRQTGARMSSGNQYYSQAEKRAHHNALERKRRDHIKDSFSSLRNSVPSLHGEKASRAQILKKASDYILYMKKKNNSHQQDIHDLKRQNSLLGAQIRTLEKAKKSATFHSELSKCIIESDTESSSDGDEEMVTQPQNKSKKLKTAH
ncbi:protein max isoform X2 [Dendroctonus ponderosae]|uniref:Protein max n=1 Tax=Dendroctonus ponderosae TaxID=77166 RepID=A0AAR5Q2W2_DENPD|nr:protein max isoform X2 [Dendroctonus ponderosae]